MTWKWSIYLADLNPTIGSEQRGRRPVLVVSDEGFNQLMPVVTVLPITSLKPGRHTYPNETLLEAGVGGLDATSLVLAHQIRTISRERLVVHLGIITDEGIRSQVMDALRVHLNL
jgi:mRNA interferase MazF